MIDNNIHLVLSGEDLRSDRKDLQLKQQQLDSHMGHVFPTARLYTCHFSIDQLVNEPITQVVDHKITVSFWQKISGTVK